MSEQAGIPIAAYGRDEAVAKGLIPLMAPEYDLVYVVIGHDPVVASKEFKALLAGDYASLSSTGVGTNMSRPDSEKRIPVVLSAGAGIPEEEFQQLKAEIGEGNFKWCRLTIPELSAEEIQSLPQPDRLATIWRRKLSTL